MNLANRPVDDRRYSPRVRPPMPDLSRGARRLGASAACLLLGAASACSTPQESATSPTTAGSAHVAATSVVFVGDSLAEQSAPYLQPIVGGRAFVPQVFGGTAPCDWLGKDLQATATSVVILSFAGNSGTDCMADGSGGFLRGQALVDKYRTDLTALVAQVRATGAQVLLVGQPQRLGEVDVDAEVAGINQIYNELLQPGAVSFVDAGAAVEGAAGAFTVTLPCLPGEAECGPDGNNVVRSDDGVHFCPGANPKPCNVYSSGAFRFASAIAAALVAL